MAIGVRDIVRACGATLLLAATLIHPLRAEPPPGPSSALVILRGTPGQGGNDFEYVGDETTLSSARVGAIRGDQLTRLAENRLKEQVAFYRAAQAASGQTPGPLYIVLDPSMGGETGAYGYPFATFRYRKDGVTHTVSAPFLGMGERLERGSSDALPEDHAPFNRALFERLSGWFAQVVAERGRKSAPRRPVPAEDPRAALAGARVPVGERMLSLPAAASAQTIYKFLWSAESALVEVARRYGLDGSSLFQEFVSLPDAEGKTLAARKAELAEVARVRAVAEIVSHEMGHVVHFATLGLQGYPGSSRGPHMDVREHSLHTLSTEDFAFTEGFAEAQSMIVVGVPREGRPGEANRIQYADTLELVRRKLNADLRARIAAALPAGAAPAWPRDTLASAEYRRLLDEAAAAAGLDASARARLFAAADADPQRAHLVRAETYVASLQARRGALRGRYDFLRSEWAVAALLARLRQTFGAEASRELLATMNVVHRRTGGKPLTLARVLEQFAADHPDRRDALYAAIAEHTEGILVTAEQAQWLRSQPADVQIDLDRDGQVPAGARSALAVAPALFPPEAEPLAGHPDPLSGDTGAAPPVAAHPYHVPQDTPAAMSRPGRGSGAETFDDLNRR